MPALALADVAAIAFALIAMLAVFLFVKVFVQLIPDIHIPLIGNLREKVNGAAMAAMRGLTHFLDASLGLLHKALYWFGDILVTSWTVLEHAITEAATTIGWAVDIYIPREIGKAKAYAEQKVLSLAHAVKSDVTRLEHSIATHATSLLHRIEHDAAQAAHAVKALATATDHKIAAALHRVAHIATTAANTAVHAAISDVTKLVTTLRNDLTGEIRKVEAKVSGIATALDNDVKAIDSTISGLAISAVHGAEAAIAGDIESITLPVWDDLTKAVSGAVAVAGSDFADARGWLGGIATGAISDVAGLTALAVATAGAVATLAEDCVIPNCRNLGGLGHLLEDLLGAVGTGAIMALIVEMAQDPEGAAQDVTNVLGPVAQSAYGQFAGLVNQPGCS